MHQMYITEASDLGDYNVAMWRVVSMIGGTSEDRQLKVIRPERMLRAGVLWLNTKSDAQHIGFSA